MSQYISQHKRYFSSAKLCSQLGQSNALLRACAHIMAATTHPARHARPPWKPVLGASSDEQALWHRYLFLDSFAMAHYYDLSRFVSKTQFDIIDPHNRLALHRKQGGLFLTYHHHFFNHLAPLLGSFGLPTSVVSLSFNQSPLYSLYEQYLRTPTEAAQKLFAGGKWIFIDPTAHSKLPRDAVLDAVQKKGNVVMAIDFNNIFPWGSSTPILLAGHPLHIPTGLLKRVTSMDCPVSLTYLYLSPQGKMELRIFSLPENLSDLISSYTKNLNSLLTSDPAFWEGWHDIT